MLDAFKKIIFLSFVFSFVGCANSQTKSGENELREAVTFGYFSGFAEGDYESGDVLVLDQDSNLYFIYSTLESYNYPLGAIFIIKYDQDDNVIWRRTLEGGFGTVDAVCDVQNNLVLSGVFNNKVTLSTDVEYYRDAEDYYLSSFILCLNPDGEYVWSKELKSSSSVRLTEIVSDTSGIYTAGSFDGEFYYEGNALGTAMEDSEPLFLMKHSLDGDFLWFKLISDESSFGYDPIMVIDQNQDLYVVSNIIGKSIEEIDNVEILEKSKSSLGDYLLVQKYDSNGNAYFSKLIDGDIYFLCTDALIDKENNLLLATNFEQQNLLTTDVVKSGFTILRFDKDIHIIWERKFEQDFYSMENGYLSIDKIILDEQNNLYTFGNLRGEVTSDDFRLKSTAFNDGFIGKWDSENHLVWKYLFTGENSEDITTACIRNEDIYFTGSFKENFIVDSNIIKASYFAEEDLDAYLLKLVQK